MPGKADYIPKICKAIRQEEKQSLLKDTDQIIRLLFSMAFGQANLFYGKCKYATSANKILNNMVLAKFFFSEEISTKNYLASPPWCPKEGWVCIGFPFIPFKKTKSF